MRTKSDGIHGMINAYKAMSGGWIAMAEETSNTFDFPPENKTGFENVTTSSNQ